ncbi:hypothetical protein GLAREA_11649 [Glarea lozoyensis ATCC 20868]|uniref:Uncharacterized protein n=1 Tax=Glarea lozoyensis (strain ATCC 20868 / MF5171) TaxID=1116229 RepID=S3DEH2_GLAL2|nr:uncharacterized protein GLAREA_11649 [Glarea lozoyensis ATCC 20868]EPE25068.1 hypothetical protein GLAREA_11649 [Glarea lozoyensis ATCC 20868]
MQIVILPYCSFQDQYLFLQQTRNRKCPLSNPTASSGLPSKKHYQDAYLVAPSTDYENRALLKVLLYTQLFTAAENYVVNFQQQSADIVLSHFGDGGFKPRALCFARCDAGDSGLRELESRAREVCALCVGEVGEVFAVTMVGVGVRIWRYDCVKGLVPSWGREGKDGSYGKRSFEDDDLSQYRDLGDEAERELLERLFESMKGIQPDLLNHE